ncbi:MAG: YraN family protein [Verrucomicrobia bacterium]|nr:YraN family protein [Verrucomicrobiota bacterium]
MMFGRERTNEDIGLWGEKQAERALKSKGFKIIDRRVRVGRRDELDIVARDGDVLVFVEVKTRKDERFGRPADSVDRNKRHVTSRAAVRYLRQLSKPDVLFRFDVVEVIGEMDDGKPEVRHISNAFNLDRRYHYR